MQDMPTVGQYESWYAFEHLEASLYDPSELCNLRFPARIGTVWAVAGRHRRLCLDRQAGCSQDVFIIYHASRTSFPKTST
jgi:hypothetical protein